jgi:hypothetical protein
MVSAVVGLAVLPSPAGAQEPAPRPPHPGPEFCVTDPAPSLRPGHPFAARVGWARGERSGVPAWVLVEEVTLPDGLPLRIVGSGCTWYVVDFERSLEEGEEARPDQDPPRDPGPEGTPTSSEVAGLADALVTLAPHHVGGIQVAEVARLLRALLDDVLRDGGTAADLLGREVPVGENELGEWFVLSVDCPEEGGPGDPGPCVLRLRAVVGL